MQMNEINKIYVNDSLTNLIQKGYIICGNCNAGVNRENFVTKIINNINPDKKYYDVGLLPEKYKYINSINEIGRWYVENVATYCKEIENIIDKNGNSIPAASEKALKNYYTNKNKIAKKAGIFCYPCEKIADSFDDYKKAGDDCVRFFFTCMNNINKKFTYNLYKLSKIKWSNVNAVKLCDNNEIMDAMYLLEFEVYDSRPRYRDYDYDGENDYFVSQITNNFVLKNGDILVSKNHVHIYLDDDKLINAKNFGWGRVNNVFPNIGNFGILYEPGIGSYYIIDNGNENSLVNKYTRIYRYRD